MKFFFGLLAAVFLTSTLAEPLRQKRSENPYVDIVKFVKKAKNEDVYAQFETALSRRAGLSAILENTNNEHLLDIIHSIKATGKAEPIIQVAEVVIQLLKATLPEGVNPTDAALTELAKKMSKILRESDLSLYKIMPEEGKIQFTNGTVAILKDIIANHPLLSEGNNFVELLKEKNARLGGLAKGLRQYNTAVKELLKTFNRGNEMTMADVSGLEDTRIFQMLSHIEHTLARLKSEENAIEAFKGFGVLIAALKNPSSYDSLEAFHKAVSKNKMIEAYGLLVQHAVSCVFRPLSAAEKATALEIVRGFLPVLKIVLAYGQNLEPETFGAVYRNWFIEQMPKVDNARSQLIAQYSEEDAMANLRQCLFSDDDRALFKQIMLSNTALVSEEKLDEYKSKSKLVYGITQLLNIGVRYGQRQVGLSERAKAFTDEIVTVPHLLFYFSQYISPSHETVEKSAEVKNMVIQKFNELPADVKMELVDFDPYSFTAVLALLD